ncbi:MAG TPA: outer membrane beta-barrel protein [Hyphomicrobiaceae bacterium]|nr:outer membrane beta-barrel protein [Hyphomicrobiaceae bacterium]
MNGKFARLGLGLVTALAVIAPRIDMAAAGGWGGGPGSIKDYGRAGVPVPAPIPVPLYEPLWYFRVDVAAAFGDSPDASESGLLFGEYDAATDYGAADPFGSSPSWIKHHFGQHATYGAGVGYRWGGSLRTDVTAESMRDGRVMIEGSASAPLEFNQGPVPGSYDVTVRDRTSIRGATFLFNGYYDFAPWGPVRPYVGGGLGFAVARLKRENETTEIADETGVGTTVVRNLTSESTETDYALAAAASAGLSFALSDATDLDLSYRYLYIGGMEADVGVNGHNSRLSTDASNDHQVRAGLRFNIR